MNFFIKPDGNVPFRPSPDLNAKRGPIPHRHPAFPKFLDNYCNMRSIGAVMWFPSRTAFAPQTPTSHPRACVEEVRRGERRQEKVSIG